MSGESSVASLHRRTVSAGSADQHRQLREAARDSVIERQQQRVAHARKAAVIDDLVDRHRHEIQGLDG